MEKNIIYLTNEKDLRIFMLPLRQKILNAMYVEGCPMTAKQVADKLTIKPSSAKHHLNRLEEIGLVRFDHTELINGITAKYYSPTNATVSIGQGQEDDLTGERHAFTKGMISEAYDGYRRVLDRYKSSEDNEFMGDIISGVVHLSDEKVEQLHRNIIEFLETNSKSNQETKAWSISIIGYRADLT